MKFSDYLTKVYNEIPIDVANTNPDVVETNKQAPLHVTIYRGKMSDRGRELGKIIVPRNKVRDDGTFFYLKMEDLKTLLAEVVQKGLITQQQADQFFVDYKDTPELKFNNNIIELDLQKAPTGNFALKMAT